MTLTVVIEPGEEKGWVGHVPMLPGCWTQGDTREEVLVNLKDAAQLWIEAKNAQLVRLEAETHAITV